MEDTEEMKLDALVDENGAYEQKVEDQEKAKTETEKSEGTQETVKTPEEKGWTTSLPKKFREEASKYENMESYLTALKEDKEKDESDNEDQTASEWESIIEQASGNGTFDSELYSTMKSLGVKAESAQKIMDKIGEINNRVLDDARKNLTANLRSIWGDENLKTNFEDAQKGYAAWAKENRELAKQASRNALDFNPVFIDVFRTIGKSLRETTAGKGSPINQEKKTGNRYGVEV